MRLLNRSNPDKFVAINTGNGEEINDSEGIEGEIVSFYKTLYEDYDRTNLHVREDGDFFDNLEPISGAEQDAVPSRISKEQLWSTLNTCDDSSPGPDGIPYSYLKAFWSTFGQLITDSWNHSLDTGKMAPSHKVSFLKLIPKVGKDLKLLTNWRPITLSNCNHKIITKTYAKRMSDAVANKIGERQTAYLRGRMINDNIRAIAMTLELSNSDPGMDGLLVALDAKKTFDSVEHSCNVLKDLV